MKDLKNEDQFVRINGWKGKSGFRKKSYRKIGLKKEGLIWQK